MSMQIVKNDYRNEPTVTVVLKYNDPIAAYRTREYLVTHSEATTILEKLDNGLGVNPWIPIGQTYVNMAHVISVTIKE